jgi:hypothetical protein
MIGGLNAKEWDDFPSQREAAGVDLSRTTMIGTRLEDAILREACFDGARLVGAHLERADCYRARFVRASLRDAHLESASLYRAHLERAYLGGARLAGASLYRANLEGADLRDADLVGADSTSASPADLRRAFLGTATTLDRVRLGDGDKLAVRLPDVRWGGANLAVVDWAKVVMLGDEHPSALARDDERGNDDPMRAAMRSYRQLAIALREQGLTEDADRFAYRAHVLQRNVLKLERRWGALGLSWFIAAIAGYGYRLRRCFVWYLAVVALAAVAFYVVDVWDDPRFAWSAVRAATFASVAAFHGRGLAPNAPVSDLAGTVASIEAFFGLVIEVCLIVTFTQRLFGK